MLEQYPGNSTLILTPEIIVQLYAEREQFSTQSVKCQKQFDTSNEIQYYVISTRFLKEWHNMISEAIQCIATADSKKQVKTPNLLNQQLVLTHLTDFDEFELKKQLQQGVDYKFYSYSVMSIFKNYAGHRIVRKGYYNGAQKKVQLHPIKFSFIYMSRSWVQLVNSNSSVQLPLLASLGYKNQTILDLLYRLVQFSKKDPRNKAKQYLNNAAARVFYVPNFDPKQYVKFLRNQDTKEPQTSTEQSAGKKQKQDIQMVEVSNKQKMFLQPPGDEINSNKMIGDIEIPPSSANFTLVVELQQQKWLYRISTDDKQRCQFCRQLKNLKFPCKCKDIKYCSLECKEKDWKYHAKSCDAQYEEDNTQPKFQIKQRSRLGLVGLSNLGNTCYMNAALQCLIHTKDLSLYFKNKLYISQINQKNPIGSKGKLIKSYAKFIQSTIVSEEEVVIPSRLKYTIGKCKEMFSGFEQHDSQQFLLFLLDTLHEDLNRVLEKPYTTGVQNQGRPDHIVARQSWITYLKRNQSFINDLMGGQYRSQVKCPDCKNISVTFDPYLIFAVPIPTSQAKEINLYYFYSDFNSETLKITLTSKNNLVSQLIEDLAKKTKTEAKQILLIVSGFNGTVRKVLSTQSVDRLINQKQLNQNSQEKQLFAMQYEPHELQNLETKKFLVFKFVVKGGKTLAFKRPFPMDCSQLKGQKLYDRICQFTLNLWSKSEATQRVNKLNTFKTKVEQQKFFKINMYYGAPTEVKNKLIYDNDKKVLIDYQTNVSQLLSKYKYEVEFEVQYGQDPHHSFNSYKTYGDSSSFSSYDDGPKLGSNESYSLEQCLNQMKKSQKLVEGNQVFCSSCQDLKLAQKKMQLYKASKYLVFQLRRFKQIGYEKSKNYAEVKFPIQLDLSDHIISPGSPENYFIDNQEFFIKPKYWKDYDKSQQTRYRLYGVVNHHGSLNGGHYTAFGSHQDKWYKFDDRDVSPVDPDKIVTNAAYLLFYERI